MFQTERKTVSRRICGTEIVRATLSYPVGFAFLEDLSRRSVTGGPHQTDPGKEPGPDRFRICLFHFCRGENIHNWISQWLLFSMLKYSTTCAKINKRVKKTEKNRKKCCVNGETGVNCYGFDFFIRE